MLIPDHHDPLVFIAAARRCRTLLCCPELTENRSRATFFSTVSGGENSCTPAHIPGMNSRSPQTLQMLLVTSAGSATIVDVPVTGPQHLQRLVGGPIAGVGIRADLAFYGHRGAAESEPPNPFIFDIIGAFGAPARMVFGDVVIFAGADENGNERPLSDALAAVLTELVNGVAGRPETVCEIAALCNEMRELAVL